jgi:hypothetical protein
MYYAIKRLSIFGCQRQISWWWHKKNVMKRIKWIKETNEKKKQKKKWGIMNLRRKQSFSVASPMRYIGAHIENGYKKQFISIIKKLIGYTVNWFPLKFFFLSSFFLDVLSFLGARWIVWINLARIIFFCFIGIGKGIC